MDESIPKWIKVLLVIEGIICLSRFVIFMTGYSFSNSLIGTMFLVVIFLLGSFLIGYFVKQTWARVGVVFGVILILSIVYLLKTFIGAFGTEKDTVTKWEMGKYQVEITHELGFAGPKYYKYQLRQFALFDLLKKDLAQYHAGTELKDTCYVDFYSSFNTGTPKYTFDQCNFTIIKLK